MEGTAKWLATRFEPLGVTNTVGGSIPLPSSKQQEYYGDKIMRTQV